MNTISTPEGVVVREFMPAGQESASQPPLVLLNGIGAGVDHWGEFPAALGRHCLAVDVAQADVCQSRASMKGYSDVVARTLDGLGQPRVDLLGLSWGGALAQETAIRHGDRLGKLVLAATLHGMQSVPPKFTAMAALMQPDRSSPRFQRIAGRIYGGDIRKHPELLQQIGVERHTDTSVYYQQLQAIRTWPNTLYRLSRIQNPTLVMAGEDDPIARPINARMMAMVLRRRAELHIVPADEGGGHLFLHTRPAESSRVINRFLDRRL